jgi:hypothetical protein
MAQDSATPCSSQANLSADLRSPMAFRIFSNKGRAIVRSGKTLDRKGQPLMIKLKLKGNADAFCRE